MKKIFAVILTLIMILSLTACGNKDMWDTVYTFDYAQITTQSGEVVEGKVVSWTDYDDGDSIQVTIKTENGETTYLTHISNVTLIT